MYLALHTTHTKYQAFNKHNILYIFNKIIDNLFSSRITDTDHI